MLVIPSSSSRPPRATAYVNPWLRRDYDDAFAAGLLIGAYHYYDASAEATKQAEHFVGCLMGMKLDLHAWLDLEVTANSEWTLAGYVNTFLEACKDGRPGAGLYCSQSTWTELNKAAISVPAVWAADWGVETRPRRRPSGRKARVRCPASPGRWTWTTSFPPAASTCPPRRLPNLRRPPCTR